MKKYVALLLALCMIFVLCACGAAETTAPAEESADTAAADVSYVVLDEPISTEQYGIGFKKGNEELRDAVLAGVYQLLKDGTMEEKLYEIFKEIGIENYSVKYHEPILTIEQADKFGLAMEGLNLKNLFLREKKTGRFFMLIIDDHRQTDLKYFK